MINFPFPKTRQGWLASVLLIALSFYAYYVFPNGYAFFLGKYTNDLFSAAIVSGVAADDREPCKTFADLIIQDKLNISVYVPLATFKSFPRWTYVGVFNGSDDPLDNLTFDIENTEKNAPGFIILPHVISDQVFNSSVKFKSIQPYTTVYGRVALIASEDTSLALYLNDCRVVLNPALPLVKVNLGDALKQSFFEALLLPPWANGVIPIFVLFICWLVEDWAVYKKTDNHCATEMDIWSLKGMMSAWRIFFSAFSVITGLVFFLWFMEFIRISAVLKYLIILPVAADLILFFVALIVGILYVAKRRHLIASFMRDHWNKYSQFATGVFNRLKSRFKRGNRRGKRKPKIIRISPN